MFNDILFIAHKEIVLTDDPAFNKCLDFIRETKGRITVFKVITSELLPDPDICSAAEFKDIENKTIEYNRIRLVNMINGLNIGDKIDVCVVCGIDFIEIIKKADSGSYDLVAKVEDFKRDFLCSSDFHLLRKSTLPVWIMRHQHGGGYSRMVISIDLKLEENDEGEELNRRIMFAARRFSKILNVKIHVISCWSFYGESLLSKNPFLDSDDNYLDLINKKEIKYQKLMEGFKNKYGEDIECVLVRGEAETEIPRYVNSVGFDIVVMGTVARTGISGYIIGNTAENILQSIASSVVAIKPKGFKSPVMVDL